MTNYSSTTELSACDVNHNAYNATSPKHDFILLGYFYPGAHQPVKVCMQDKVCRMAFQLITIPSKILIPPRYGNISGFCHVVNCVRHADLLSSVVLTRILSEHENSTK